MISLNRKFGFSMGIILGVIGLYRYFYPQNGYWVFVILAVLFAGAALIAPMYLNFLRLIWDKIGHYLGIINTTIILTLVYIGIFIPLGLIMRLLGYDLLGKKFGTKQTTYWQNRDAKVTSSLKNQF
jgi:hypothetical protein